ncbi:MAG: hypothetical protein GXN92_00885 [Candidatus Micrarchaeota archaeon]|nr:hypothetical protein [Candidatus Micrarchaeota archaeon]
MNVEKAQEADFQIRKEKDGKPIFEVPRWRIERAFSPGWSALAWLGWAPSVEGLLEKAPKKEHPHIDRVKALRANIITLPTWELGGGALGSSVGLGFDMMFYPDTFRLKWTFVWGVIGTVVGAGLRLVWNGGHWAKIQSIVLHDNVLEAVLSRNPVSVPPAIQIGMYSFYNTPTEFDSTLQYTVFEKDKPVGRIPYISRQDPETGEKNIVFLLFHPFKSGNRKWLEVIPEFLNKLEEAGYKVGMAFPEQNGRLGKRGPYMVKWPDKELLSEIFKNYFQGALITYYSYPHEVEGDLYYQVDGLIHPTSMKAAIEDVGSRIGNPPLVKSIAHSIFYPLSTRERG